MPPSDDAPVHRSRALEITAGLALLVGTVLSVIGGVMVVNTLADRNRSAAPLPPPPGVHRPPSASTAKPSPSGPSPGRPPRAAPPRSVPVQASPSGDTKAPERAAPRSVRHPRHPAPVAESVCRDLEARGSSYRDAVTYWRTHGRPTAMDANGNGIPCETVYPASAVSGYWRPRRAVERHPARPAPRPAPATAAPRPGLDVFTMSDLIDEHATAVTLAEMCRTRAVHRRLAALCTDSETGRQQEIGELQSWLRAWYDTDHAPAPNTRDAEARRVREVQTMSGERFESRFLPMLIAHDRQALRQAKTCLAGPPDHPELRQLCGALVQARSAEVRVMRSWLCRWYARCGAHHGRANARTHRDRHRGGGATGAAPRPAPSAETLVVPQKQSPGSSPRGRARPREPRT